MIRPYGISKKITHPLFSRTRRLQKVLGLLAVPLLLASSVAGATNAAVRTTPQESAQKKAERKKTFLLRSADEVNRSLMFAHETIDVLTEQIESANGHEPEIKVDERAAILKWYQHYAEWLSGISDKIEFDMRDYFSGKQTAASWVKRSQELEKGCGKIAGELRGVVGRLEGKRKTIEVRMQKLRKAVGERRILVNKDNLELARELWPRVYRKSYNRRKAVYKDLTEEKIRYLGNNLALLEDQRKYYDVLIELGKYEQGWLRIKARDFSKLANIARTIARDDPAGTVRTFRSAIRTYEADIVAFKRRTAELEAKLDCMIKTGSFKTIERFEELSRYYELMKSRFERQIEWLNGQIESYKADFR